MRKEFTLKLKLIAIFVLAVYLTGLGLYVIRARSERYRWEQARQQRIAESPVVYVTAIGKKYHRAYHYRGRSFPISLYEATEQHYDACLVCRPRGHAELSPPLGWYYDHWIAIGVVSVLVVGGVGIKAQQKLTEF